GRDELVRRVLHRCDGEIVLHRVGKLDVAEGTRLVFYLARDPLVALAAEPDRPVHGRATADLLLPLGADLRQVVHPDVGGTAPIRSIHDHDGLVRARTAEVPRPDL